jgi:hypothetical protein
MLVVFLLRPFKSCVFLLGWLATPLVVWLRRYQAHEVHKLSARALLPPLILTAVAYIHHYC